MMTLEDLVKKEEQEALALQEAIEHAEQKAADENDSCGYDHKQLAKWLKELQEFREEWNKLEQPYDREYGHLRNDLEQLAYLADEMAFDNVDISYGQQFIWRSVREIVFRASDIFRRAKYFEKQEVSNQ